MLSLQSSFLAKFGIFEEMILLHTIYIKYLFNVGLIRVSISLSFLGKFLSFNYLFIR